MSEFKTRSAGRRLSEWTLPVILMLLALTVSTCISAETSNCIGQAKAQGPSATVSLADRVVTGVFPGFFYVQDPEAGHTSCGIMVKSQIMPTIADTVTMDGTIATDPATGELCIEATSVNITGTAPLPKALGRTNRSVGSTGINTIGVLQTTWGKVSNVITGQSMTIDDGSKTPIKVVGPIYGIVNDNYARVTGIASLEPNGVGKILRTRDSKDACALGITPPTQTEPLIDLSAANLPLGDLAIWPNAGTLGGIFGSDTTTPTVAVVDGKKCVTFADSDRLKAAFTAPSGITGNGDYSVVFWAHKTSLLPEMPIVSWAAANGPAGTAAQFSFGNTIGNGAATHGTDPFDMAFGTLKPSANYWHQVVVTFDGTTESVYLDGLLNAQEAKTLSIAPGQRIYLGCGYALDGSNYSLGTFLQGSIASLQVYDYALTQADITRLYTDIVTTRTISGRITHKTQGYGITSAKIYVAKTNPAAADPTFYAATTGLGFYSVTVPAGVWQVMIGSPGYLNAVSPAVDVTTSDAANLNFALTPSPSTELLKLDAAYMPLGPVTSVPNAGMQGGAFTSCGTAPIVEVVDKARCITFDGSGYLKGDFALPMHATATLDWTVSAWVYNPSFAPEETIFSWAKSGGAGGTGAKINFGDSPTLGAFNHSDTYTAGFVGTQPAAGAWHHVAVTYYVGQEKVYVDGVLNSNRSKMLNVGYGCPAFIGCGYSFDGSGYFPETLFSGSIAQLSVQDRALDATTIAALAKSDPRITKVMPLGDSITDGYNVPGGYRIKLWSNIINSGKHVDFVGSMSNGPTSLGDKDNEGHGGWQSTDIMPKIDGWMDTYKPQIVLLHICTNDIYFLTAGGNPAPVDTAITRLSALIDKIYAKFTQYNTQNAKIYVAQITPRTDNVQWNNNTMEFNSRVPALVAQKVAEGKNIAVVNMYGDPVTNPNGVMTTDLADGLHPSMAGYDKMADIWFNAIKDDLNW